MAIERELIQRDLRAARAGLDAFQAEIDDDRLLARLDGERPWHPLLLLYRGGLALLSAHLTLCLVALASPLLGRGFARLVGDLDAQLALPLPLILMLLAYGFGAVGVIARWFAVRRARACDLLPWEREHRASFQREIHRFEEQLRALEQRERDVPLISTPRPALKRSP